MGDLVATLQLAAVPQPHVRREAGPRGCRSPRCSPATTQTAEGVKSSQSVLELARAHGVEMPITEVMVAVMHDGLEIGEAVVLLASRIAKPERYGV